MSAQTWLQGLTRQLTRSGRRSRGRPSRRWRWIGLFPEGLEVRMMLAGGLTAGVLDPSFGQGGLVTTKVERLNREGAGALQRDGKIVVAGTVQVSSGADTIGLARLLPDGRLDPGFGLAGSGEVALDPGLTINQLGAVSVIDRPGQANDGKIVVAGTWTDPTGSQSGVALVRFNPDGSLDTSFGNAGAVLDTRTTDGGASDLAIQPDGKILVGGTTLVNGTTPRGFVERFNTDGTADTGFADPGVATAPTGWDFHEVSRLAVDPNLGLFVAGRDPLIAVAHLAAGGQLDPSFGSGGIATAGAGSTAAVAGVDGLAIDPNRGLVVAATTAPLTTETGYRAVVTRFDFQGRLDASFNNGSVEFVDFQSPTRGDNLAGAVAVEANGQVLLAGATGFTGSFALARLNPDGTPDTRFGGGEVVTTFVSDENGEPIKSISRSVLVQADGNIVVTGTAGSTFALARYLGGSVVQPPTPQPPLVGPIATPGLVLLGRTVTASASFTYNIPTDQHTAVWDWGDHTTSTGTVTEANGSGSVTGSHVYAATGIYPVTLTVTDQRGASGSATAVPGVVVIELILGGITGSGLINGPPFTVAAAPAGQVRFRLAAQYGANRTVPQGQTVFQFQATHRVFRSTALDFLVVTGKTAWYGGSGTINGAGSYGFLVAASSGGKGAGTVRIRIWDKASGAVVYDSQPGAPLNAAPATVISRGRIALHVKHKHKRTTAAGPA